MFDVLDIWSPGNDPLCPRRVGSNFWAAQKTTRCPDGSCSCYQTDHVGRPQLIVIWHGHHRENEVLIQWGKWQILPCFCWQTLCFRDLIGPNMSGLISTAKEGTRSVLRLPQAGHSRKREECSPSCWCFRWWEEGCSAARQNKSTAGTPL